MSEAMKEFQCNKKVLARPMSRQEYNDYRGWELPSDEDGSDEGYLVEYVGSPNGNHPEHMGYISWSPKSVFDAGYHDVSDWQGRLALEEKELSEKLASLQKAIESGAIPESALPLLRSQFAAMANYQEALLKRMAPEFTPIKRTISLEKIPFNRIKDVFDTLEYRFHRTEGTNETVCSAVLNGKFVIASGTSGCLKDEDFNQSDGEKYARERAEVDAMNALWKMEGYAHHMRYIA